MKIITNISIMILTATIIMAQEQTINDDELKHLILTILCDSHRPFPLDDENGNPIPDRRPTAQILMNEYNVTLERMTSVLEDIIRERLPIVNKGENNKTIRDAAFEIKSCISSLGKLQSGSLELLKECSISNDKTIRDLSVRSYIFIAKEESVPFLREAFREVRIHTPGHIFFQLVELIEKLKEEKKHAGFKNVVNFLKDMTQTRYGIANFDLFDHILCENIKGYEKSAERQIILEKNKAFHKKIDEEMRILNEEAKRIAENFERQLREKKLTGKHEKILYHYLHPSLQTKQNNPFTKNHPLIKSSFGLLSSSFSPSLAVWLCGEKK